VLIEAVAQDEESVERVCDVELLVAALIVVLRIRVPALILGAEGLLVARADGPPGPDLLVEGRRVVRADLFDGDPLLHEGGKVIRYFPVRSFRRESLYRKRAGKERMAGPLSCIRSGAQFGARSISMVM
jgi:hypothetical protein